MLIHFQCRRCRKLLFADACEAGSPFLCSHCKSEILVPLGSDPAVLHETSVPVVVPRAITAAPTATGMISSPGLSFCVPGPPAIQPRKRRLRPWLATAVAVQVVLLLIGGLIASNNRAQLRDEKEAEILAALETLLAERSEEKSAPLVAVEYRSEAPPQPQELRARLPGRETPPHAPTTAEKPAPLPEEKEERQVRPIAIPAPVKEAARAPEKPAEEKKPAPPQRQKLSEEQLARQLAAAPEIGLTPQDVSGVIQRFSNVFQTSGGTNFEPTTLLAVRPDLVSLPIRDGGFSRLSLPAAANLQMLSQKLHLYLDRAFPPDFQGNRHHLDKLRDGLRAERRGQRPEWLRTEAIPTLLQLLMHEDRPLRLLLVDLLSEIEGRTAAVALAQRAVFDLAPEVREVALQALAQRPPQEYRHVLLNALRYPWAPAADHSAEALAMLGDRAAIPYLVHLLKEPDPSLPVQGRGQLFVREVVKLRHTNNCLTCHPPAGTGNDPVTGPVPGTKLVRVTTQARKNPSTIVNGTPGSKGIVVPGGPVGAAGGGGGAAAGGGGYGGGGVASSGSTTTIPSGPVTLPGRSGTAPHVRPGSLTVSTNVSEAPLLIRADITYVRQDFSLQLPIAHPAAPAMHRRFDYVVRTRAVSVAEAKTLREQAKKQPSYPQREAVLHALRALAGQDVGAETEAWVLLFPTAEFEIQVTRLSEELVQSSGPYREQALVRLRDGKGVAYTQGLAVAIPRLQGTVQEKARAMLAERLTRMNADTLRDKLQDEHAEIRRAAALACGLKQGQDHVPDLMALLEDPEAAVAQAAAAMLQRLTNPER